MTGNSAADGGALCEGKRGTIAVIGCSISRNFAISGGGGGLYNDGGTTTLTGATLTGNSAADGGALCEGKRGTIAVIGCSISGNSATNGGGLYNDGGTATLTDGTLSANSAATGGGLFNTNLGSIGLTGCTISGNSATNGGGGVYNDASASGDITDDGLSATVNLYACTIGGNSAASGAGIDNAAGGGAMLEDTIVASNTAPGGSASDIGGANSDGVVGTYDLVGAGGAGGIAGGIGDIILTNPNSRVLAPLGSYGGPTPTMPLLPGSPGVGAGTPIAGVMSDQRGVPFAATPDIGAFQSQTALVVNTITDGTSAPLGALSLRQAVSLANALNVPETITFDSTVFAKAQTITLTQGQLELSDTGGTEVIVGSTAGVTVSGGGQSQVFQVDAAVTASIAGLTITGGSTAGTGGGLSSSGTTTLTNCTLSGNSAAASGGGLSIAAGTTTLTNCTVSGNSAGEGGGLYSSATIALTDCTVSGNSATSAYGGIYVSGAVTLNNTIVAGNTGGSIGGSGTVSGSNNLIGTGGSGGLINMADGNLVGVADPGLAPLGDFGGSTETMALLPGSAAIGAGTASSGITTDQRGAPRPSTGAVDIGAFQDQGYTLAVSSGSPQSTPVGESFNASLVVMLTENFANVPLPGATIAFSAPSSAASATLSASSAVTDANGLASVTATANTTTGTYDVTATATGATSVMYDLTNIFQTVFSGLTSQTITYGSTVTFAGTISAGSQVPVGEQVAVTVDDVTQNAMIASDGSFSTEFTSADVVLNASSTPYTVTYLYATDGVFPAANGSSELTVTPAQLTITAVSDTRVYDGTTSSSKMPTFSGTLFNGNTVTGLTEAFAAKNVLGPNGSTLTVTGYTINDGDGGKDYTVTTVSAPGTITPAALTISATSDTKVYDGTTTSSKTPTYGTLDNGDTVTGLTQAFASMNVLGTNRSTLTVTGYIINDGDGGKDYTVTTETATGTITPAPLMVTAKSVSSVYGSPLPALSYSIAGFVGGDNSSVVSGAAVIATTAAPGASAGAYTITVTAGTLSAANYSFPAADLMSGTLTITPAPLVITAVSTTIDTGQPVPALKAVYTGLVNGDIPSSLTTQAVLHTSATQSSAVGSYPITVDGASSPNYTITYVPGTLTVLPQPATVETVSIQRIKLSKHKTVQGIVLQFSEALDSATAQSISSYTLATVPKTKKQKSKPVQLSAAAYNSSTFTVTLLTRKMLVLKPPVDLTVKAASLLDAFGRELDGNDSGQSGANFTAVLKKAGASVTSARPLPRFGSLSSRIKGT